LNLLGFKNNIVIWSRGVDLNLFKPKIKNNKKNNIYEYLIFLHENYFNHIPLLLDKLTKKNILKNNPFTQGYYVMVKTSEKNNIDKIESFLKIDDEDNTRNVRRI
jgi:hypothetical protein